MASNGCGAFATGPLDLIIDRRGVAKEASPRGLRSQAGIEVLRWDIACTQAAKRSPAVARSGSLTPVPVLRIEEGSTGINTADQLKPAADDPKPACNDDGYNPRHPRTDRSFASMARSQRDRTGECRPLVRVSAGAVRPGDTIRPAHPLPWRSPEPGKTYSMSTYVTLWIGAQ